jgi:hypothetical protein
MSLVCYVAGIGQNVCVNISLWKTTWRSGQQLSALQSDILYFPWKTVDKFQVPHVCFYLLTLSINHRRWRRMIRWLANTGLEGMWKEAVGHGPIYITIPEYDWKNLKKSRKALQDVPLATEPGISLILSILSWRKWWPLAIHVMTLSLFSHK